MTREVVSTDDGSITCIDEVTGELYHNRAGAFTEAFKNFVEPLGLAAWLEGNHHLVVLDVCFGLGYNSFVLLEHLLSVVEARSDWHNDFTVDLVGLEKDAEVLGLIPLVLADKRFDRIRSSLSNIDTWHNPGEVIKSWQKFGSHNFKIGDKSNISVNLDLRQVDIRKHIPVLAQERPGTFECIFHDGFSPSRMPELWTVDLFGQYVKLLKPTGKILTYSAATAVRGAFQSLGLVVQRTCAVGGKSGGTIASFQDGDGDNLISLPLTYLENSKLKSRSATPYRDPTFCETRELIRRRREEEVLHSPLSMQPKSRPN